MKSHDKRTFVWFCSNMNVWASIEIHTQCTIALGADVYILVKHSEEDPGKSVKYKQAVSSTKCMTRNKGFSITAWYAVLIAR